MYIEFDVPEISEYASGFPQYWLKIVFIQSPSTQYQINALTSTYVRLVEAAIVEYHAGAAKLKEFWNTHTSFNLGAMHRSMSHFEACISDMHRATNCFRRLRGGQDPLCAVLRTEKAQFANDTVADVFRAIRNEIHHLEGSVMDGTIRDGQPFALHPDGLEKPHPTEPGQTIKTIDRLVIGSHEVLLRDLATWLKEMGRFATIIAEFLPSESKPNSPPAAKL